MTAICFVRWDVAHSLGLASQMQSLITKAHKLIRKGKEAKYDCYYSRVGSFGRSFKGSRATFCKFI